MPTATEITEAIRRANREKRSGKDRATGERDDSPAPAGQVPPPHRSAAADFADLPKELATKHNDLLAALANGKDPQQGEWPGEKYLQAHGPADVGRILIGVLHPNLQGRVVKWLWREHLASRGLVALGKARIASGLVGHFSRADFILEFNWTEWWELTERQRVALVDHELTHCSLDIEKGTNVLVPHDVEEFGSIVSKWGLWRPPLKRFVEICREASQLALFDDEPAAVGAGEEEAADDGEE